MVADALVFHPTVAHYLRFAATTVGRDKLMRTVQYFARFYVWYRLRTNATTAEVAPWAALKAVLGKARKLLQAGKNLEHFKAAVAASQDPKLTTAAVGTPLLRYATVGRQLSYASYLTIELVLLPETLGVRKLGDRALATRLKRESTRLWTAGLLCSVVAQVFTLRRLQAREARIDRKDGEGVVESKRIAKERSAGHLQLFCDVCDLTNTTSSLGWTSFDDGVVGLAGAASGIVGIYNQWKKTA
ncbi:Peroxisomal membrane protein PMP27 [Sporothrix curviconia]|uniref:Peroxisomal membrane protein PMP27 n=1 Tax=Sporothrix curviconia TaxID=1260050 RepID=A0ABP0BQS4_9PEZI